MTSKIAAWLRAWDVIFGWRRRNEAAATLSHVAPFLHGSKSVLDIGCGMGHMVDVLSDDYGALTLACDVGLPSVPIERFTRFDGRHLPFADKSVDVCMLIFVLHHADDASVLLREACRVARSAVLVVEDTPRNKFDEMWGQLHIRSFSGRHGIPWLGEIRRDAEWRQLFQSLNLKLAHVARLGRFERLPPVARTAFVLEPAPAAALQRAPTTRSFPAAKYRSARSRRS